MVTSVVAMAKAVFPASVLAFGAVAVASVLESQLAMGVIVGGVLATVPSAISNFVMLQTNRDEREHNLRINREMHKTIHKIVEYYASDTTLVVHENRQQDS